MLQNNNSNNNNSNRIVYKKQTLSCVESDVVSQLYQGILKVLSTWNALQMALQNKWGGNDTLTKSEDFVFEILTWFRQSKGSFHVEDLENLLHERMLLSFNTDIEDGSIEEIAEQLLVMHEGCLHRAHV
ncbi:hypothetical protein RND81_05G150300 [Saponaria officinalis]|uniref:Pre-rRNA-processing protein TSR2 homolog n=1 Tax=Saponaria officinalis TaxID=3572 RepID=A0AAW1KYS2_SAPOF